MDMTFDEYINNPMGRKNAVFGGREMYRTMYKQKLDTILVREVGKINYTLYKAKKDYYIHIKIPSEPLKDFYYDTVIQFYTKSHSAELSKNLKKYYVKFYSNDPAFVYTFAHAMKTNDMFIQDLAPKMSKQALKKVASEKNPKDEIGYVKSIFFAYLIMEQYSLFEKSKYDIYGEKYDKKVLLSKVEHADKKIQDRIDEDERQRKQRKIERRKETVKNQEEKRKGNPINVDNTHPIKATKKVGHTPKANKNKVAKIKKVKKI